MHKYTFLLAALILKSIAFSQPQGNSNARYANGEDLVKAMYNNYAPDKWYRYFTFSQEVEFYRNDSILRREVWHEAYRPGSLIIKVGNKAGNSGRLYNNFTIHSFHDGKETQKSSRVHELLLVGLDVYFFKPELTIKLLDSLGYDLSKIRQDEYEGRAVFVVGADKGDEKSRQFWIDAERLYMHRVIYGQKEKTSDVVFGDYIKMGDYWIAKTISFKTDGKLSLIERYYDIKFLKKINDSWFIPDQFNNVVLD